MLGSGNTEFGEGVFLKKRRITLIVLTAFVAIGIDFDLVGAQSDRQERHRLPAEFMSYLGAEWLEREDRVIQEQPELVLRAMDLEAGRCGMWFGLLR